MTQQRTFTRSWPCWYPDLRLPAFGTVRNKFLLFSIYPLCDILLQHPEWTKTMGLPLWHSGKESSCQCRRRGFNPCGGISARVGNGNPTQYSFLENFMDRVKLAGYSPWSLKDLDMTEQLSSCIGCTELSKFSHLMWSATIISLETWQSYSWAYGKN